MLYSLIRESKVVMIYEGREYHFDALSNFDADTSYTEYKAQRKTLHNRTSYADSKVTEMNPTTLSLSLNITSNFLEFTLLEILGLVKDGNAYLLPYTYNIEPKMVTMFIINPEGKCTKLDRCFLTTFDFSFNRGLLMINVGVEAARFESVNSFPNGFSLTQSSVLPNSPVIVTSNGKNMPGVIDANISFQQQCGWRYQRSVHDINKIYSNSRAVVNEMNSSCSLNLYYVGQGPNNVYSLEPEYDVPITIQSRYLTVDFPSNRITKRLSHADVYTISYDISPMPHSAMVSVTINGEK